MKSHSNYTVIPWSLNQVLVILAVWAGANPALNTKFLTKKSDVLQSERDV